MNGASSSKAVPAEEYGLSVGGEILSNPVDDHRRLNIVRIVGKLRHPSVHDLEALTPEVLGT